jgi:transposase
MSRIESTTGSRRVRRRFTEEFKAGAVWLVIEEGNSVGAVARKLDLAASVLGLWVKHTRAEQTKGKSGLTKEERQELARLRKETRILQEERDS